MNDRPHNDPSFNKDWADLRHWFGDKRHFRPWYDDDADYNTNAKSYYDFLARFIRQLDTMIGLINKLLAQDIAVQDSNTAHLTKDGDWQNGEMCNGEWVNGDSIETLTAYVKISAQALNAIVAKDDGIWAKDFQSDIDNLYKKIDDLQTQINNIGGNVTKLMDALTKILQNLQNSGAWTQTGDTIFEGQFNPGRDIATGNINLFGGTQDGSSFIRTNKGSTENDVTAGIN